MSWQMQLRDFNCSSAVRGYSHVVEDRTIDQGTDCEALLVSDQDMFFLVY